MGKGILADILLFPSEMQASIDLNKSTTYISFVKQCFYLAKNHFRHLAPSFPRPITKERISRRVDPFGLKSNMKRAYNFHLSPLSPLPTGARTYCDIKRHLPFNVIIPVGVLGEGGKKVPRKPPLIPLRSFSVAPPTEASVASASHSPRK